jgi:hypothetical protein
MDEWVPASVEEVERAVNAEKATCDSSYWAERASIFVKPYSCAIERWGSLEHVFVVARAQQRVVYFDDIEEEFGTARELEGRLVECAAYGSLILALQEAASGG